MSGWIKLHRKFLDWEWYDDQNVARLFIHLLLSANHKESKYRGHKILPGSLVSGRIALSEQTGLSQQQVRTALDKLKSTSEITIKITNKFSVISIACWNDYQGDNQQNNQPITNNQPTSNQQVTTSKEGKKVKKVIKGCRIPSEWTPTEDNLKYATDKGFSNGAIQPIAEDFKDYWIAASGQKAVKRDWDAAWRMWIRNQIKFNGEPEKKGSLF